MKICYYYNDMQPGGVQHMMLSLAAELQRRGHQTEVLVARPREVGDIDASSAVASQRLNAVDTATAVRRLAHHLRRHRPDILYTGMPTMNISAVIANQLAGRPTKVVVSERSNPDAEFRNGRSWRYRAASRLQPTAYRLADAIVAVSEELADDLSVYTRIPRDRIRVHYNPAYDDRAPPASGSTALHPWLADRTTPTIVAAGRFVEQKNFAFLLRVVARIRLQRPVRLILLGDGPLNGDLRATAVDLNLTDAVAFPGFVPDVMPWFEHGDVFALTSIWEGFGNVLVQALAAGCGVVATQCRSGPAEILAHGRYGRLVAPDDEAGFAQAVIETIDAPWDRTVLRERAERFSLTRSADSYETLFSALVAG